MQQANNVDYGVLIELYEQVKTEFGKIAKSDSNSANHSDLIAMSADLRRVSELNREAARQIRDTIRAQRADIAKTNQGIVLGRTG